MKTYFRKIQVIGGSYYVSIPKKEAKRIGLEKGSEINMEVSENRIVIEPTTSNNEERVVFTIGYEQRTIEDFIRLLKENKIFFLADLRERAFSRKNGFRKGPLQNELQKNGIIYVGFPSLGAPKELREELAKNAQYPNFFKKYKKHMLENIVHLGALMDLVKKEKTAIMCYERDYRFCHRKIISEWLEKQGIKLIHL